MIIYKITNLINGKCYVGQTIGDIKDRMYHHKSPNSRCNAISGAIQKYGWENFSYEVIDTATNQEELDEKETYWIAKLNTRPPFGYNLRSGGHGGNKLSPESREKVTNTLKEKWSNGDIKATWSRKVCQYDKQGNLLNIWDSIRDAGLALNIQDKHIPDACRGKRRSVGGYMWRYYEDTFGEPIEFPKRKKNPEEWFNSHRKPILQCDLDGNIIKRWNSTLEAAQMLNMSTGYLCDACNGKHKKAYGYIWRYADTQETG